MGIIKILYLLICLKFSVNALSEDFEILADETVNLLLPYFTSASTFEDFNKTIQFMIGLKPFPLYLCFFVPLAMNHDWSQGLDYADFLCNPRLWADNDEDNLRILYNWSVTTSASPNAYPDMFKIEVLQPPDCEISSNCYLTRFNIIIISDSSDFSWIVDLNTNKYHNYFYYGLISTNEAWIQKSVSLTTGLNSTAVDCYNVNYVKPTKDIKEKLFNSFLVYTVDYTQNAYNFFIIANESELTDHISIASYLHAYANEKGWDSTSPSVYFALIQKEDKKFYDAGIVVRNKLDIEGIRDALLAVTTEVNTSLEAPCIQKYLEHTLETPLNSSIDFQWNVLITANVPLWVKKLFLKRTLQRHKMLDLYVYSNNNDERYKQMEAGASNYFEAYTDSTKFQETHLSLVRTAVMCDAEKSYWPTGRIKVPQKFFNFHQVSHRRVQWYFICVIVLVGIVAFIVLIAFLMWRRRVNRMLKLKFAYALQGGFAPKEIEETVEKWKKMFIDERYVEVCFENIRGKGSSSIIYDAVLHTKSPMAKLLPSNLKNQDKAVIKIVNKFGHDDFEQVLREVNAALKIGYHKHVCCLLGWSIYLTTHALIYENVEGNDLHSWIKMYAKALGLVTEMQIAKILWQISDGMEHIAARGIVHRDLAARNILVTAGTFEVKITDFGLASFCNKQFLYQAQINRRLPLRWMAPESLSSRTFSEASDVWSFGVLIWELFTFGEIPYGKMEGEDIVDFVSQGNRLHLPSKTGEIWHLLTSDCWKFNRDDRPSFKAIRALLAKFLEERTIDYGYLRCKFE